MRLISHTAVVCTSSDGSSHHGMTVSSLTSLALDPVPILTFNVGTPSRTLEGIRGSSRFNVHVLHADGQGARLADWFSRAHEGDEAFRGIEGIVGVEGDAVMRGEGVMLVLRCKLVEDVADGGVLRVRDHAVVFGEVQSVEMGETRKGDDADGRGMDGFALAYADRRFRQLGKTIVKKV